MSHGRAVLAGCLGTAAAMLATQGSGPDDQPYRGIAVVVLAVLAAALVGVDALASWRRSSPAPVIEDDDGDPD